MIILYKAQLLSFIEHRTAAIYHACDTSLESLDHVQDKLLEYMEREFNFDHLNRPASIGDAMHFHSYSLSQKDDGDFRLQLDTRLSTDEAGIATCLGLQAEARVELEQIITALEKKISDATLFTPA